MLMLYATDRPVDAYLLKALREAGHVVDATRRPADGLEMAAGGGYQALVLDGSAPSADRVRRYAGAAPDALLLVIAPGGEDGGGEGARAAMLNAGADACFARPFDFIEIEARLEALERLVRRASPAPETPAVEIIVAERAVRLRGRRIALSPREFNLMTHLASHAGQVISLESLCARAWGDGPEPRPDLARRCLAGLRRKLDAAGAVGALRAVAGHGYRFQPERPDGS